MGWKTLAVVSLLWLAAAAAPPDGCSSTGNTEDTLPMELDLAGRPTMPTGLSGQGFAALRGGTQSPPGCQGALPSASQPATLRSETGDVLHGLPAPDILRPMDEPRRSPQFR